jgi:hypothetical protein
MRKIVLVTTVLAALAAAAPASGATLLAKACRTSCSSFSANGSGVVSIVANGAEWGTMSSGTIWMRDRTGRGNPRNWVHGRGLHWKYLGRDGWRVSSTNLMTVSASTKFWIKLQGRGIKVCGVFDGSGTISGSGTYSVNGHKHRWPGATTHLQF